MGFRKYGQGEIIPEEDDKLEAVAAWTEEDQEELAKELADDDGDE